MLVLKSLFLFLKAFTPRKLKILRFSCVFCAAAIFHRQLNMNETHVVWRNMWSAAVRPLMAVPTLGAGANPAFFKLKYF